MDDYDEVGSALGTLLDPEPPMRSSVADDVRRGRALRVRRQRWLAGGVAAAVVLGVGAAVGVPRLLTGTTAPAATTPSPSASDGTDQSGVVEPTALFGFWTVHGTGTDDGATLQFGSAHYAGSVTLYRACGGLDGSWVASPAGGFLATLFSGDSACFPAAGTLAMPGWLVSADAFRSTGDGIDLLDRDGRVVVALTPGAQPTVAPNRSAVTTKPFVVTPEIRAEYAARVLPDGVVPASRAELVGRWVPTTDYGKVHPFLKLTADGSYHSSDGCNQSGGRWTVDRAGVLLATSGASTAIGCRGLDTAQLLTSARTATVDGDTLTFLDQDARTIGVLTRP
jgi:hypothetical protein